MGGKTAKLLFCASFDAAGASQNLFAGWQSGFLKIRVFSCCRLGIIFAAELYSFSAHSRSFATNRTMFHNTDIYNMPIQIFQLIVLIFSVVIHEFSHGYAAYRLGDDTAKNAGRLTLNPLSHLDLIGSLMLLIVGLGWAKPVPYNPSLLYKDYKYGPLKVALAGPFSNFSVAVIFGIILRLTYPYLNPVAIELLGSVVFLNCLLAVFNLLPIPPLDGSSILAIILPRRYSLIFQNLGFGGIILVLMVLMLFPGLIFGTASLITSFLIGG